SHATTSGLGGSDLPAQPAFVGPATYATPESDSCGPAAVTSSMRYLRAASITVDGLMSPLRASALSVATVIDSAAPRMCLRAAGRVSEKPNPSVPSEIGRASCREGGRMAA